MNINVPLNHWAGEPWHPLSGVNVQKCEEWPLRSRFWIYLRDSTQNLGAALPFPFLAKDHEVGRRIRSTILRDNKEGIDSGSLG